MRELYKLELVRLVKELGNLEGLYIDQFYELGKDRFRFRVSGKGEKANLNCVLPYSMNRTDLVEVREDATNFTIAVRNRIAGSKIKSIGLLNDDRIILVSLESKGEETKLILEMFGRGNMIIADSDMKIKLAYHNHDFADRSVRPGAVYMPPKNSSINAFDNKELAELEEELKLAEGKDAQLANYLNKRVGLGKMYVEEAIAMSKVDANSKIGDIGLDDYGSIFKNIKGVIDTCIETPQFLVYYKNGEMANFSMCSISRYAELESKKFESLEETLEFVYRNIGEAKQEKNEDEEKTVASIEKQMIILNDIDAEIKSNREMADYVMKNMHELNGIIDAARSNKGISVDELKRISKRIEILSISMKTKSIRIKTEQ
jgi:predicted ribosome quality control (RQC) complex YloA/Tae2 family protein